MHRFLLASLAALMALAGVFGLAGCGGGAGSAACGRPVQEALDSRSTLHLFPGAPEPTYHTDPPTSGPHKLGNHPTGVLTAPIDRPVQVAMLESGAVLLQWKALTAGDQHTLAGLAGGAVTVAPDPDLHRPGVVATAWSWKVTCSRVDTGALRRFVAAHAGVGAGHP